MICLLLAGCPDEGPAQLACSVAAGAFAILRYCNDVAPVLEKDRVNSSYLKQSEKCFNIIQYRKPNQRFGPNTQPMTRKGVSRIESNN